MPRVEPDPRRKGGARQPQKPERPKKRGTPVRNSILILIFAAILVALVVLLPNEPARQGAAVLASGGGTAAGGGAPEDLTLRISEVMSSNRGAYPDDKGNYSDWVEIENTGDASVSLEGIGLSDRDDRVLFLFPAMELAAGSRVVVFCDDTNVAAGDAPLHARFKISSLGETIYLYDRSALVIDWVAVPAMNADMSYALMENGEWAATEQYTPGYPNTEAAYQAMRTETVVSANGLVLNELMASNRTTIQDEDGEYSDWIELYNGGALPIDLANYALSDDPSDLVKWRFPQGAVIEPGGYYLVFASGKDRAGGNGSHPHTNFKLAAEGETVTLSDVLSQVIDRVTYENLDKDVSYGRVEGLEYAWDEYKQPTPGLPNNRQSEIEMDARMRAGNTTGIYISEVVSSSTGLETPYGMTSYEWIELVNLGDTAVNLQDWGLSDRVGRPRKWQFGNVTVQPGEYLLVFPSGLTESPTGSGAIHADFRLSAMGETVVLSRPDGAIVDKLVVPKLEMNNSYGRDFDRGGLFYYDEPTAGAKNTSAGFTGYASTVGIDTPGGIYVRPISVTLSAPEGVRIRYTTDGSNPTETVGHDYTGPIEIKSDNVVLRARGFADGLKPSDITTESYLMNVYHILPVVSVVVDPNDLWDPETGIYADGVVEDFTTPAFDKATYWVVKEDDALKARAANFEFFTSEGKQLLNQGVDLQLHGQFSMDLPQKSLRITAKAKYGKATLAYPFFEDRPYTEYQSIILRNGGNMGVYARINDVLMTRMAEWVNPNVITMASTPCIVYLNGEYWGQYYIRERINKHYIARYEGWDDPDAIDLIKGNRSILNGSYSDYRDMLAYLEGHDLNDPEALETVLNWMDVDSYFDCMIFQMYFGNTDTGNIKFYRQQAEGSKWKWILYDLDWGFFNRSVNMIQSWTRPGGAGDQEINNLPLRKLLEVPSMEEKFLERFAEIYKVLSDTDRVFALIDELVAEIDPEMPAHYTRWAEELRVTLAFDPPKNPEGAYNFWKYRVNWLKDIINDRPHYIWAQIQEYFELSDDKMMELFGEQPPEYGDIYH